MLKKISTILILVLAGTLLSTSAFAAESDELDFETEAGLTLDLAKEISKQEQQITIVLKAMNGEPSELSEEDSKNPNHAMTVTLISKK